MHDQYLKRQPSGSIVFAAPSHCIRMHPLMNTTTKIARNNLPIIFNVRIPFAFSTFDNRVMAKLYALLIIDHPCNLRAVHPLRSQEGFTLINANIVKR